MSELREFRIYVDKPGEQLVRKDIMGRTALARALEEVAREYPGAQIVVREVHEDVVEVHLSDSDGKNTKIF